MLVRTDAHQLSSGGSLGDRGCLVLVGLIYKARHGWAQYRCIALLVLVMVGGLRTLPYGQLRRLVLFGIRYISRKGELYL